jgi:hypothetical protein
MTQVHNAFKMPYQENETEKVVSFDRLHHAGEVHPKHEMMEKLLGCDDGDSQLDAVLGYD